MDCSSPCCSSSEVVPEDYSKKCARQRAASHWIAVQRVAALWLIDPYGTYEDFEKSRHPRRRTFHSSVGNGHKVKKKWNVHLQCWKGFSRAHFWKKWKYWKIVGGKSLSKTDSKMTPHSGSAALVCGYCRIPPWEYEYPADKPFQLWKCAFQTSSLLVYWLECSKTRLLGCLSPPNTWSVIMLHLHPTRINNEATTSCILYTVYCTHDPCPRLSIMIAAG